MDCPQKVRHFLGAFFMGQSKYDLEFKLKLVKEVLVKNRGVRILAGEAGIDYESLRRWVRFYELYGDAGLVRQSNRRYDLDFKVNVLQGIDKEGLSLKEAARRFNIAAESSILNWQRLYRENGILGLKNKTRGRPPKMDKPQKKKKEKMPLTREEELLEELKYLRAENAYLKKLEALVRARKGQKP